MASTLLTRLNKAEFAIRFLVVYDAIERNKYGDRLRLFVDNKAMKRLRMQTQPNDFANALIAFLQELKVRSRYGVGPLEDYRVFVRSPVPWLLSKFRVYPDQL
jgi:hypothetical protein